MSTDVSAARSDTGSGSAQATTRRPSIQEITDAYDYLFRSGCSIAKIKDAALRGRLFSSDKADEHSLADVEDRVRAAGVVGRSLAWKLFLIEAEPLTPRITDGPASPPLVAIKLSRKEYQRLLLEKLRAPDGSYEDGFIVPGTGRSPLRAQRPDKNLEMNNPLSLHDENPWTAWFASVELRKEILQDVERTFPDIGYFRDPQVQTELTYILYLYSVTHSDIGYRQGMHELLASLYYAVDFDSILAPPTEGTSAEPSPVEEMCSRVWVAADAWALFSAVMRGAGHWYEWREAQPSKDSEFDVSSPTSAINAARNPLASHVQLNVADSLRLQPYVAPIVQTCNRIQSVMLKSVDPHLWKNLQASGIEPQIYGIRWLRLLFTREFGMDDSMILWDGLFAVDPTFELAPWICVAMLIRIRNHLFPSDYSTQLTYLLRYPSSSSLASSTSSLPQIHPCTLLLRQALTLQMSPVAATGMSVVQENFNMLNIPIEVPDTPPSPTMRRRPGSSRGQSYSTDTGSSLRAPTTPDSSRFHFRQGSTPMSGLPEMIARGLLERGESLGINKTVMNAVSEIKRNLPDLSNTLTRLPTPMTPSAATSSYAAYALVDERPSSERPPWEPRTRFEMEREIAQLQNTQRRLGDSLAWIVDTLLLDEGESGVPDRKREAVECLSYVRDVLKGIVPAEQVEEYRLLSEEEGKKRKEKARKEAEEKAAAELAKRGVERAPEQIPAGLTPPKPTATALPQFQAHPQASVASQRRSQDYFTIGTSLPRSPPKSTPIAGSLGIARQKAPSPTPTISVLPPNKNALPLAPWNSTPSAFSSRASPIAAPPRMPSRPAAIAAPRPGGNARITAIYPGATTTSQTPAQGDQAPPSVASRRQQQDPLGVLP